MSQRHIKLKEWGVGTDIDRVFDDAAHARSDGSIEKGTKFKLRTDENGFIVNGNDKIVDGQSIVFLGDSFTESMFNEETARYCSVAERTLRERGFRVNVLNGGATGATSLNILNTLLNKVVCLRPQVLVVQSGTIDISNCLDPDTFWTSHPYYSPIKWSSTPPDQKDHKFGETLDKEDRGKLFTLIAHTCKLYDIKLCMLIQCRRQKIESDPFMMSAFSNQKYWEKLNGWHIEMAAHTKSLAGKLKAPLLNLNEIYGGRNELFYDAIHLNDRGGREIGATVGAWLSETL